MGCAASSNAVILQSRCPVLPPADTDAVYRPFSQLVRRAPLRQSYRKQKNLLGAGSYAVVWRVSERASGCLFAAKLIKPLTEKTAREVELHNFLPPHENIIRLRESLEYGGSVILILEYAMQDLYTLINSHADGLSEEWARKILRGTAQALAHCHHHKIAHLDVKPENILLMSNVNVQGDESCPSPKLCDFGEAVFFEMGEYHQEAAGAPDYCSPEVLQASYLPMVADMWSLGVTLFAMLSGQLPFTGPTRELTFQRIRDQELDINPLQGQCSQQGVDLVHRLLTRDTGKRLTARQVLAHPWLDDTGTEFCA